MFVAIVAFVVFPSSAFATPSLSGNTLTWTDAGWHQVQRADTFETVCEGAVSDDSGLSGGPCTLSPGNYIVINHSSGERFENITVNTAIESTNSVSVSGNTISWPDDGWYQVQDASTYSSICEGGTSCAVQAGTYVVINHTTGQRFNDIRVGSNVAPETGAGGGSENSTDTSNTARPDSVVVTGNTIRWPDNGWYQVQNADTFVSICEGGSECLVSAGSYIVINHSTGERQVFDVGTSGNTVDVPTESMAQGTTRVTFDITVPVYVSNELQVQVIWGSVNTTAAWVVDETWTLSADLDSGTENQLIVRFNDRNGGITLGSFERSYRTGTNPSESVAIAANQFDTNRWDNDGDGVSNLNELRAGTDPLSADASASPVTMLQPVQVSIELERDKTFRISWEPSNNATHYRVLENPDGISGFSQIGPDLDPSTQSYDHRVALYKRFNASYIVQACNASVCVESDEQLVSGTFEQAIGYFKASNTEFEDLFGTAVSLSSDGTTLAVSAHGESNRPAPDGESDAVYVFHRSNGRWELQAVLTSNTDDGNQAGFGIDISLSGDGSLLAVGATRDLFSENAVYVFERTNGSWQQQAFLQIENTQVTDNFGRSVSLSADGTTLAIGAPQESSASTGINGDQSDNSAQRSGAVYVFLRVSGDWQQQAFIKASNTDAGDNFGQSVSISGDGNTLAVGARFEASVATGVNGDQSDNSVRNTGAAYVFERVNGTWEQQAYLKAANEIRLFASALSLSGDGNTLAVGASQDGFLANVSGAVYIYGRSGSFWQQEAYLKASNPGTSDLFGSSLDLSADGMTLAVGASREDSASTGVNARQDDESSLLSGAVYLFEGGDGNWQQQAYLKASNTGAEDLFGASVSMSGDGNTLAVGATSEGSASTGINGDQSDNSREGVGAVYLY